MGTITHAVVTGAPSDPTALVDGPAWDAAHVFSLTAADVGLGSVNNTSDANKPVSTAQAAANAVVAANAANASNLTSGTVPAARLPATAGAATFLATPTSANLAAALTDETGTGSAVFATNPQFTNNIGVGTPPLAAFQLNLAGTIDGTPDDASCLQVTANVVIPDNSTHTNIWGQFIAMGVQGGTARVITEGGGLRILDTFLNSGASITTQKGLRIDNLTAGGSNYSIITNGAANTGLGTNAPQAPLHINRNTTLNIAAPANTLIYGTAADGADAVLTLDVRQNGGFKIPQVVFRNARGTGASPTAIQSGDFIGLFGAQGYGTSFTGSNDAYAIFVAAENFTGSAHGTRVEVGTTPTGTTSTNTAAAFHGSKGFSVGGNTDPGAGNISATGGLKPGSFTVSTLPASATGLTVFCSNVRVFNGAGTQEGAAAGTGGLVTYNSTAWKVEGTNITAVA